ncbi:hypothetical protein [uncultured Fibrella sp.]|uniref:hypothetical protein n=1 Tax=uncultured Fibrella sp. TaxID=1284596 RepID=UPI0035CAD223
MDSQTRSYTYSYDATSRLLSADYSGGQTGETYAVGSLNYDRNGNLTGLKRWGKKTNGTFGLVDDLTYSYEGSNQIKAVSDAAGDAASFSDVGGSIDYTYWPDGSLKSDANKQITQIDYNYLGRPRLITFAGGQTIQMQYDGTGRKLRQIGRDGTVTDYVDNLLYRSGSLQQIAHDEGRIVPDGSGYRYEWAISDHLGNLRVMFRDSNGVAKAVQEEGVGPWGESLPTLSYSRNTSFVVPYVFTGHERMLELGVYDANARTYDPVVPRFWQTDPLAERRADRT